MKENQLSNAKLKGRIIEKYDSVTNFANAIKRNRSSISLILNGKAKMKREDIALFSSALDIKNEEIGDYFF